MWLAAIQKQCNISTSEIMSKMERGVTVLHGHGGYTKKEQNILYCVIPFQDLPRFKELVRKVDSNAFVVITETMDVMGHGVGNQPHW